MNDTQALQVALNSLKRYLEKHPDSEDMITALITLLEFPSLPPELLQAYKVITYITIAKSSPKIPQPTRHTPVAKTHFQPKKKAAKKK